jgi:hypothetical protein
MAGCANLTAPIEVITLPPAKPPTTMRRLLHWLGIDRAVGYTLMNQGWTVLLQPVTMFLTLTFLTKEEQGYFYTFGSILGLQNYFDLGVGLAMQQSVSHETSRLHWSAEGTLEGDAEAKSRLASLWRLTLRWYAVLATAFALILLPLGWWLFSGGNDGVSWEAAWTWIVAASVAGFLATPALMLIRGSGRVADAAKISVAQTVATNVSTWGALAGACRLLSGPIGSTVGLFVQLSWIVVAWRPFLADLHNQPRDGPTVRWWREVWPFQWKIALGWPFGYLVYQLFNPVLFRSRSPEEAGQMGISLAVGVLLSSVSMTWINTKMPLFTQIIARNEWGRLDATFWAAFKRSTALAVAGAAAGSLFFLLLPGQSKVDRFLPPGLMALILLNAVVNHVIFAVAAYVRAHRQEPFLSSVIVMGTSMAVMTLWIGPRFGSTGLTFGYVILNAIFMVRCVSIFARCRREWHQAI